MAYTDPYSPPQASLGSLTPSEQADLDSGALRYSGFWQRVGAYLIDFLIISPLLALDYIWGARRACTKYMHWFRPKCSVCSCTFIWW